MYRVLYLDAVFDVMVFASSAERSRLHLCRSVELHLSQLNKSADEGFLSSRDILCLALITIFILSVSIIT